MAVLPRSVEKVIEEFGKLPGVGPKSAARMAYFFLRAPRERSEGLAHALIAMKDQTKTCSVCFNVADMDPCAICSDRTRNRTSICVVEEPLDVVALEQSGVYSGTYFVLGGVVSPADGIGPEQLRMRDLKSVVSERAQSVANSTRTDGPAELEIIIATNPSLEGEATSAYIHDMLDEIELPEGVTIRLSRLAVGLPTGADLEYADRQTLKRALEGRTTL